MNAPFGTHRKMLVNARVGVTRTIYTHGHRELAASFSLAFLLQLSCNDKGDVQQRENVAQVRAQIPTAVL